MLCDKFSTFGSELSLASTGIKGDVIDMGSAYNIGAGANKTPYLVITTDTAITGANCVVGLYASGNSASIANATKLMSIPLPATGAEEIAFAGNIPAIPEAAAGQYLILNVDGVASTGTVTAQIVDNPPVMHIYPAV